MQVHRPARLQSVTFTHYPTMFCAFLYSYEVRHVQILSTATKIKLTSTNKIFVLLYTYYVFSIAHSLEFSGFIFLHFVAVLKST